MKKTPRLTKKENEVLGWVHRALSNKQIAKELNVTEATVKMHMGNLLRKYNARNRTELFSFSSHGKSIDLTPYIAKDFEAKPDGWLLRKKEKVIAISFQKVRPSPEWEGVYIKKSSENNF